MQTRYAHHPDDVRHYDTERLRDQFLIENVIAADQFHFTYSHYDRFIVGGVKPVSGELSLPTYEQLRADYFLERRELGIINVGGPGVVTAGGERYELEKLEALYIGKGTADVRFASTDAANPAVFYLASTPAHRVCPTAKLTRDGASPVKAGTLETSNERTIYKYIHAEGLESCQLVMGLTILNTGSVWNTMPSHVHDRRMEAYFYFDVPQGQRVFHFMGQPQQTRHLLVDNYQAILSPPWSIHSGAGTSAYSFIWAMAGENYTYTDMDPAPLEDLR
ncbi:5-dehydro-4-deoxy-D-glucuronate isomerase [Siphonobacter aquaeclarae]|uniref:4-deoxy-L-threo-5-hexosulose-uronate ketol-isomerase n=1 Tax=Siphonobacter aquaeclarae TaxID=563176 RepID=A0A1G9QEF7_9BACT|nr:5-dehydro-4-deoxy-D-glucuronate isomerase [Siphonobacter aquaeclarae]SDM09484.1 4-deoxy-L-threo-5-hexulose uronate isomerase [Siphonobacter aquaeclarae]